MSKVILCDSCRKTMYADSRSEKGSYHEIWIDRSTILHLCRECFNKFMLDTMHRHWNEDEQQWTD